MRRTRCSDSLGWQERSAWTRRGAGQSCMPDGDAFFLLRNPLINLSWDNLTVIYHTLTGGVAVRNDISNNAPPTHGAACMAPSSRRCPSAMTYGTSVLSAVTFTPPIISQAVQTLSRPPRRIQRHHRHRGFHVQHGRPWASQQHGRLPFSCHNPQTAVDRGIRVRWVCRYSFPTPCPYSHGTLSPRSTRATRSRVGSDTTPRPYRISTLIGVHPPSTTKR